MYGMVNKALEEMVIASDCEATWELVKQRAGVDIDVFVTNQGYSDDVTYKLVGATCEVLGKTSPEILRAFGKHWVLKTARDGYGNLMDAGGSNLVEFLNNLPNFHSRVSLIFPHLEPPRFACTDVTDSSLRLHYYSHRFGLADFVVGLLDGLGEQFRTPLAIEHEIIRGSDSDHDVFQVRWDRKNNDD